MNGNGNSLIDLAQAESFSLGPAQVDPATRLISLNGESRILEPRVMQVLVALAEAAGAVVSRHQLVLRCWGGRAVGEDAIHRAISQLRRTLVEFVGGAFWIETIARVGYRLRAAPSEKPAAGEISPPVQDSVERVVRAPKAFPAMTRRGALALGLGVAATGAGTLLWSRSIAGPDSAAIQFMELGIPLLHTGLPEDVEQSAAYFREAVRADPNSHEAWAHLAFAYAVQAKNSQAMDQRARAAASRALALASGQPNAAAALLLLTPLFGNWLALEHRYRQLLSRHPRNVLLRTRYAYLLSEVGRWREAAAILEGLVEEVPAVPLAHYRLINAYWCAGRIEDAEQAVRAAVARWPRHAAIWEVRFKLLAYTGRPQDALALLEDPAGYPPNYLAGGELEVRRAVVAAAQSRSAGEAAGATGLLLAQIRAEPAAAPSTLQHIAALGALDIAFSICEGYFFGRGPWSSAIGRSPGGPENRYTGFLFSPLMAGLRNDSRFAPLVRTLGLSAYWRASRSSPDFMRRRA